jgi:hypothetical protein
MLVLDAFRCHRTQNLKTQLEEQRTDLSIIPGGMTSMLQPLDVSVNKPMKTALRQTWSQWISSDDHLVTAGGRMRKAELTTICTWVKEAWDELNPEIIVKAFKKCTISNALDGSEDDCVWQEKEKCDGENTECEDDDNDVYYDDEDYTPLSILRDMHHLFKEDDTDEESDGF